MIRRRVPLFQEFLRWAKCSIQLRQLKYQFRFSVWKKMSQYIIGKHGLEIGGPSTHCFGRDAFFPVYGNARELDVANFSEHTLWSSAHPDWNDQKIGQTFTAEITELSRSMNTSDNHYDFVLASHVLEHTANPIKALTSIRQILRPHGALVLVMPHREATFDWKRPVTTLDHMVGDWSADASEDDLTHLDEILMFHDFSMDPGVAGPAAFLDRAQSNFLNRGLHHHVFDLANTIRMVEHCRYRVVIADTILPCHVMVGAVPCDFGSGMSERKLRRLQSRSIFVSDIEQSR